jgi:hypothetical protein
MEWTTPFKWAFEVGMWGIGVSILLFVIGIAGLFIYALVRGFGASFRSLATATNKRKRKRLSPID